MNHTLIWSYVPYTDHFDCDRDDDYDDQIHRDDHDDPNDNTANLFTFGCHCDGDHCISILAAIQTTIISQPTAPEMSKSCMSFVELRKLH